jgi:hypothetical protein
MKIHITSYRDRRENKTEDTVEFVDGASFGAGDKLRIISTGDIRSVQAEVVKADGESKPIQVSYFGDA